MSTNVDEWPQVFVYGRPFTNDLFIMFKVIDEFDLWEYIKENKSGASGHFLWIIDDNIRKVLYHPEVLRATSNIGYRQTKALECLTFLVRNDWDSFYKKYHKVDVMIPHWVSNL